MKVTIIPRQGDSQCQCDLEDSLPSTRRSKGYTSAHLDKEKLQSGHGKVHVHLDKTSPDSHHILSLPELHQHVYIVD